MSNLSRCELNNDYEEKCRDLFIANEVLQTLALPQQMHAMTICRCKLYEVIDQLEGDCTEILEGIVRKAIEDVKHKQGDNLL